VTMSHRRQAFSRSRRCGTAVRQTLACSYLFEGVVLSAEALSKQVDVLMKYSENCHDHMAFSFA
jgi:hypothetical protein